MSRLFLMLLSVVVFIAISFLSACVPEKPQNELEVFIVVGAGNGVPMSGRSVYFFDDSLITEISRLKSSYNDDLDKLYKEAIDGNPEVKKRLQQRETAISEAKTHYQKQNAEYETQAAQINKKIDQEVSKRGKKYIKKLSSLKKKQEWLKKVRSEFETKTKKFDQKIVAVQNKIDSFHAISTDNNKKVIEIYNDYIVRKELPDSLITSFYVTPISADVYKYLYKDGSVYFIVNSSYIDADNKGLGFSSLNRKIAQNVSSLIDPLLLDGYQAKIKETELRRQKAIEEKRLNNVIVPLERKYGSDLAKKFNSYDLDFEIQLETAEASLTSEFDQTNAEQNKINSKASRKKIERGLLKALKKPSEDTAELITLFEESLNIYKKEIVDVEMMKLNSNYSAKLFTLLIEKNIEEGITDLEGRISVPEKAEFAFIQANRLSKEAYTWLIRVNEKTGKQILTNQNVTHDGSSVGAWIFDELSKEIDRLNKVD